MTQFAEIAELVDIETSLLEEQESKGYTIIHCQYTSSCKYVDGGWISIWPTTYLVNISENTRLQLLHAINIPLAPQKHYFKRKGQLKTFTLIFPAIPKHWTKFSLNERSGSEDGFNVKNITRNNSGIYRVAIN